MGIFGFLAGRIGLPLVLIAGAGALIFAFRSQLISGASGLGSTIGQVITTPFTSFFDSIRNAFSNLGDININIPGINITGGGFNFDLGGNTTVNDNPFDFGDDQVQFPPGCTIDSQGRINCDSPPAIIPPGQQSVTPFGDPDKRTFLDILQSGFSGVTALEDFERTRSTKGEIIQDFPTAVGLFDVTETLGTERIPLSFNQLQFILNQGIQVRLSSQLFEEFSSVKTILEFFA